MEPSSPATVSLRELFIVLEPFHSGFRHFADALAPVTEVAEDGPFLHSSDIYYRPDTDVALLAIRFDERSTSAQKLAWVTSVASRADLPVLDPARLGFSDRRTFYDDYLPTYRIRVEASDGPGDALGELARLLDLSGAPPARVRSNPAARAAQGSGPRSMYHLSTSEKVSVPTGLAASGAPAPGSTGRKVTSGATGLAAPKASADGQDDASTIERRPGQGLAVAGAPETGEGLATVADPELGPAGNAPSRPRISVGSRPALEQPAPGSDGSRARVAAAPAGPASRIARPRPPGAAASAPAGPPARPASSRRDARPAGKARVRSSRAQTIPGTLRAVVVPPGTGQAAGAGEGAAAAAAAARRVRASSATDAPVTAPPLAATGTSTGEPSAIFSPHPSPSGPAAAVHVRFLRGDDWVPARLRSLSLRGARLATAAPPRLGDRVQLVIGFERIGTVLTGEVTQVTPAAAAQGSGEPCGFSVHFGPLRDDTRAQLTHLLRRAKQTGIALKPPPARTAVRFPVYWPLSVTTQAGPLSAAALDVSRNGLFLASGSSLLPGELDFQMPLDHAGPAVCGRAQIAREVSDEMASARGLSRGYGVRILDFSRDSGARYDAFLERVRLRTERRLVVAAAGTRATELSRGLTAAGYAVQASSDPSSLMEVLDGEPRGPDAALIDAALLGADRAGAELKRSLTDRHIPCLTVGNEPPERARTVVDHLLRIG